TDELLDRAAVALDHLAHTTKPTLHRPPQRLRIDPLAQRRRPDHVGEDHRDQLAPLAHRNRGARRRRPARRAEPGALRRPLATRRTRPHVPSLKPPSTPPEVLRRLRPIEHLTARYSTRVSRANRPGG